MYVAGTIDGIFYADGEGGRQSLCRSEITNQGEAELVLNRLSDKAERRSLSAVAAVRADVADRLSCPVTSQANRTWCLAALQPPFARIRTGTDLAAGVFDSLSWCDKGTSGFISG